MTTYRLLRDNKETGPFSEEEMIAKGFKPYDLIWVEGRSAGWRYPSEIPAFKNFAPAIEEQPYDRFYKKQPPQKLFAHEEKNLNSTYIPSVIKEPAVTKENELPRQQQPSSPSFPANQPVPDFPARSLPARHIHVTLPSGNRVNLTTMVSKNETTASGNPVPVKNVTSNTEARQPAFNTAYDSNIDAAPVKESTKKFVSVPAETSYHNIIDGEENINSRPVYQSAGGFSWGLIAASFIGFATLVGLGIMIGLSINKTKNEPVYNTAVKGVPRKTIQQDNANQKPVTALPDAASAGNNESVQPVTGKELVQNAVVKNTVLPEANDIKEPKELKKALSETASKENNKTLLTQDETPVLHPKPAPVINVEKSLSLTANDFKTGAFGGITGLKYTLYNGSRFPIESVEVEIDYIQANNKVYKTEKLLFKDISAGAQATIDAPSSTRGIKITGRIIKVNSKEASLTNTTAKS